LFRWSVPTIKITWKTGYVAIASRRGEGRGNRFASRLVTVARSLFHGTVAILEDVFMLNPNLPMKISKNDFFWDLDPLEDDNTIVMLILWEEEEEEEWFS
jgi:hypothetical protein